jgi:hypothetical protein
VNFFKKISIYFLRIRSLQFVEITIHKMSEDNKANKWKQSMIEALKVQKLNECTYIYAGKGEGAKVGVNMNLLKVYNSPCIIRVHSAENFSTPSKRKVEYVSMNININDWSHEQTADVLARYLGSKGYANAESGQFHIEDEFGNEIYHDFVTVQVDSKGIIAFLKVVIEFVENYQNDTPESIIPVSSVKSKPAATGAAAAATGAAAAAATSTSATPATNPVTTQKSPAGYSSAVAASAEIAKPTTPIVALGQTIADEEDEIAKLEHELQKKKQQLVEKKKTTKEAAFQQVVNTYSNPANGLSLDETIARLEKLRSMQQQASA